MNMRLTVICAMLIASSAHAELDIREMQYQQDLRRQITPYPTPRREREQDDYRDRSLQPIISPSGRDIGVISTDRSGTFFIFNDRESRR